MSTPSVYPASADIFYDPGSSTSEAGGNTDHAGEHTLLNHAVSQLETTVGTTGSAVTTSLTYRINNLVDTNAADIQPVSTAAAAGATGKAADAGHVHVGVASLPLATTVTGPDAFGAAAVVGTSTALARGDHNHGLPAAPAAATTVTGPDAFGAAAVVGTGTAFARNDHNHGLPNAPTSAPLALVQYAPSTGISYSTTSTTFVAIDSTNLTFSFVAPASGRVLVNVTGVAANSVAGDTVYAALFTHGTTTVVGYQTTIEQYPTGGYFSAFSSRFVLSGLTAGTTYSLDVGYAVSAGTAYVYVGGGTTISAYSPFIIEVVAA